MIGAGSVQTYFNERELSLYFTNSLVFNDFIQLILMASNSKK